MTTTKIENELRRIADEFNADEVKLIFINKKKGEINEFNLECKRSVNDIRMSLL